MSRCTFSGHRFTDRRIEFPAPSLTGGVQKASISVPSDTCSRCGTLRSTLTDAQRAEVRAEAEFQQREARTARSS